MRQPPSSRVTAAVLFACLGCGNLHSTQGDIAGGPGPVVTVDGSSNGGRSGRTDGGGAQSGQGGAGGAVCLGPGSSPACGACEATQCTTNTFIYGEGYDAATFDPGDPNNSPQGGGIDWYHACYNATGTITSGPMQGAKKSDLCAQIVTCIHQSGCNAADTGDFPCFCGVGVTSDECASPGFVPRGPCKDVIEWGAESTDPLTVANRSLDYNYAAGAALGLVITCDYPQPPSFPTAPCAEACLGGGDAGASTCNGVTDGGVPADASASHPDATGHAGAGGAGAGGGAGGAAGGGSGSPGGCATTYDFADAAACASCASNASSSYCDPTLLTATVTSDPDGNPVVEGFGPETLPTKAQRDAAFAIIERVLALKCYSDQLMMYRPGDKPGCETQSKDPCIWPNLGCLLDLGQPTTDVASGIFATAMTYSALAEYEAAAIADGTAGPAAPDPTPGYGAPGGISAGASNAVLGTYINAQAIHPSSAIGIADTVLICALNSGCSACFNLKPTTICPNGTGGAAGAGGAGGGGGAGGAGSAGAAGSIGGTGSTAGSAGAGSSGGSSGAGGGAAGSTCPDLDRNGVPDCQETLVQNAGFDSAASGWTSERATTASWTSQDGNGRQSSGAIAVMNSDTNPADASYGTTTAGAFQCVPVSAGACYQVDVQTTIPTGQANVSSGFLLDEHTTADCSQSVATRFVSPQVSTTGSWQTIAGTTTQIPLGVASAAVRLVASKPVAQASAEALFDNVLIRATACASVTQ